MADLFDEEASRAVEAAYLTPDVVEQREAVVAALAPLEGAAVLDLGSGPGLLAADLVAAVGRDGSVTGVDLAESMLELARRRCPQADFVQADVTSLPFDDESFDRAVSTQVYEYVADMPAALAELRRVLRPGGRALILDTDIDSTVWHSEDPERMRRMLAAWEAHCHDPRLPRKLPRLLRDADLQLLDARALTLLNTELDENAFSNLLVEFVARFATDPDEAEAWQAEQRALAERGEYFFSLTRYLFLVER